MWIDFSSLQDDIQLSKDQIARKYRFYNVPNFWQLSSIIELVSIHLLLVLSYIFLLFYTRNFLLLIYKTRTIKRSWANKICDTFFHSKYKFQYLHCTWELNPTLRYDSFNFPILEIIVLCNFPELKMGFDAFDPDKKGIITNDTVSTILGMMGMKIPTEQLQAVIAEFDTFGKSLSNRLSIIPRVCTTPE